MTLETVQAICRALPNVTEDIKWGHDLCFCIAKKMFAVVSLEPPHSIAFKCTPDTFGELVERPGIIPAPYIPRNMWVQEVELGSALGRRELDALIRSSYELVVAKLPKREQARIKAGASAGRRSRAVPAPSRRRRR